MKSWVVEGTDTAPKLQEAPEPAPARAEVKIKVAACGLNFADLLMLDGRYQDTPARPYTPGMEVSGTVVALGDGLGADSELAVGQRVAAVVGKGGMADYICVPAERVLALPPGMSMAQAAGFQIAYGTSHLALTRRAGLRAGETLVVTGASGGVGLTAVDLGKRLGARVIGIARGVEKQAVALGAGADAALDSDAPDLRAALKALGGADVIYDTVGGALFDPCLRALRPEGRYLAIGFASGTVPQIPANLLLVKNISVIGLYWGGYLNFAPQALHDSLRQLLALHEKAPLQLHISHELPFAELPRGLDLLSARASTGKIVISWQP
jgi:NADPH2:quinone reductase